MSTTAAAKPAVKSVRPLDAIGIFGGVICCLLWGGNAVATRFAIPDLPPIGCAALRFLIAIPLVAAIARGLRRPLAIPRAHWRLLSLNAALAAIQIGTFNWGTGHSEAGRSSVFINIHPLVVAPLAWLLLGEQLGARGVLGLLSAAGGVGVLLAEPLLRGGGLSGDVVVLVSGFIFATQTIVQKKTFPYIPPVTLLFWQTVLAVPLCLVASAVLEGFGHYAWSSRAIGGVLYQGIATSGICFAIWLVLLDRYPAGKLATIVFLTPIFGVGLGCLMRGEALTRALMVGGGLVGLGIYLTNSERATEPGATLPELPGEDAP
ncbi:MAG: DMT family transporter [Planctomycetota bacterium]|nr:DMT family transporter [Planctomycetota bacterium]